MLMLLAGSSTPFAPTIAAVACVMYCSCDPSLCPKGVVGRVLYGLLVGVVLYVLDPSVAQIDKIIFACLLGTITAPLLGWIGDTAVTFSNTKKLRNSKARDTHVKA